MVARNFNTYLSSQIGEHLVAAELGRRGIVASVLSGNMPDVDILAFRSGKSIGIQVKSIRAGSVSVDLKRYLDISIVDDLQTVNGVQVCDNPNLIFVIVKIGESFVEDRFYLLRQAELQELLRNHHEAFLRKHNGRRPRNPTSLHGAYGEQQLECYLDNWALVEADLS